MPRLGSTKVKTGCFACKTRRVKCDEIKPFCHRCTSTHRQCPGYPVVTGQARYSWANLLILAAPTSAPTTTTHEARSLAFFRAQVAPALSRHSSEHFWTVLVAQMSLREPSVRCALAAISALYEARLTATKGDGARTGRFAIAQYNKAVAYLRAPEIDGNIVLLVCLLFICIEAIEGNKAMAIQHCRHGILLCNDLPTARLSGWVKDVLQPIFLRLATFPYFFGMPVGDFPEPKRPVSDTLDGGEQQFDASSAAWDSLVNRAVRLIRQSLDHERGPLRASSVPDTLVREQVATINSLAEWRRRFQLQRKSLAVPETDFEDHVFREIECMTGQVWVGCCIGYSEMAYDAYVATFEDILNLSQKIIDRRPAASEPRPIFSFEMGFLPFLHFIVLKCRRLDLRVRALQHILVLAHVQENLFSSRVLYGAGLRLVELEHRVRLGPGWPEYATSSEATPMPLEEVRFKSVDITDEQEAMVDEAGVVSEYQKVYFLIGSEASMSSQYFEWVKVGPFPAFQRRRGETAFGCL